MTPENNRSFGRDEIAQIGALAANYYTRKEGNTTTSERVFEDLLPTLNSVHRVVTRATNGHASDAPIELRSMVREYQPRLTQATNVDIARTVAHFGTSGLKFEDTKEAAAWNTISSITLRTILGDDRRN